jgi:AcrR family transcriptional regulator
MKVNERRALLREDLIAAAQRRIADDGLENLRARDLAKDAGCALGAIYNAFADLDELVIAVNGRTLLQFEAFIAERLAQGERSGEDENPAIGDLVRLALAYLEFALKNPRRWKALFAHRLAEGTELPDWYHEQQARLFARIEGPVRRLSPKLDATQVALLGRTVFSATHGVVSLGLDEKLATLPAPVLRDQLDMLVRAIARGLRET